MIANRITNSIILLVLLSGLAGCNMPSVPVIPGLRELLTTPEVASPSGEPITTTFTPPPETLVSFHMQAPPNTPGDAIVYLAILDEVTGLALNTQLIPMVTGEQPAMAGDSPGYSLTLPLPIGSLVKYRYERQMGSIRVAEHKSEGNSVRCRILHVTGQSSVEDIVSRWTDTSFLQPTGRIQGQATDAATNQPIPNLLVAAGGLQTLTASDGSFMLEGLPPGVHNLVALALDGSYQTFQQGAKVAEGSTTPAALKLNTANFANIVFVVTVPKGTLPVVPLRMAGNFLQFGNTFADLAGGVSTLAGRMPVLSLLPDGRYTITAALPVGADLRYKFTLGDGFWNAEHNADGSFRLRQLIVPDQTVLIEDSVETWYDKNPEKPTSLTFDVKVPSDTPSTDYISIQFNPLIGWGEPIPMWRLGETRWAYVLYSPLNLPGNFGYRYCRNGQCGYADDAQTAGLTSAGRSVKISDKPQTINDQVNAWANWSGGASAIIPTVENVTGRGNGYWAGIALLADYHPSWNAILPEVIQQIKVSGANWFALTPTWSYGYGDSGNTLPLLALDPGHDALWTDLSEIIHKASSSGLNIALHPMPRFKIGIDDWWTNAPRDESWWQVWFEQYRTFAMHHADLAERNGVQALILGGDWLLPALPGGALSDGLSSGLPQDSEARWIDLLAEIRTHFSGQLIWAISTQQIKNPPTFLSAVDRLYLELPVTSSANPETALGEPLDRWMDVSVRAFQALEGKPIILAAACASDPDLQAQVDCYQTLLSATNSRDWISGFISTGYYPPAALRDTSTSVHGKPANELLGLWFPQMIK